MTLSLFRKKKCDGLDNCSKKKHTQMKLVIILCLIVVATVAVDDNRWINVSPIQDPAPLDDGPNAAPTKDADAALWCVSDIVTYLLTPSDGALWRHENFGARADRWIRLDRLPNELSLSSVVVVGWMKDESTLWMMDGRNEIWSYDPSQREWIHHETLDMPGSNVCFSETWYDETSDTLWNYGNHSQLWTLSFDTMMWKQQSDGGGPDGSGSVVHRQGSTEAFLYGESSELWRLDMETLEWSIVKVSGPDGNPGPRRGQLMWLSSASDGSGDDILHLYGGATSVDDGVWTINVGSGDKWEAPTRASSRQAGPRDRFGASLCQVATEETVYAWGGRNEADTERWNDLWMYGARTSFIQEGWQTLKSDQTFAAASLAAAMSTICFFVIFCYLVVSLVSCIHKRRGGDGFEYRHEEFT